MQLASFGCSLIHGDELADSSNLPSQMTWPALLAKSLGMDYRCYAGGGRGNLMIMDRLTTEIHRDPERFFVIQWTYIDRFDYSDPEGRHALIKKHGNDYLAALPGQKSIIDQFYFKNFHSEFRDKITNLVYIKSALDLLLEKRCKFVMTHADDLIWCDQYHTTDAMRAWQSYLKAHTVFFENRNFMPWCREQGYDIGVMGHPLEQAHRAAADLIRPVIESILHKA